jgi:formylglycine-generating enzyme required for sulfatase activity
MKFVLTSITALLLFSCTGKKDLYDVVRKIPKQKLTPFGTIWIKDNLFMDETEITNFSYHEFLSWLQRKGPKKYIEMLPDTNCWIRADVGFTESNPLNTLYIHHKVYKEYPVVGVSYQQAIEFCEWRTNMVNTYYYMHERKLKYNYDNAAAYFAEAPKKVKYRLPTKEEWEYAAAAGLPYEAYPLGYEKLTNKKNWPVSNTLEYYIYYKKIFADYKDTIFTCEPTNPVYNGKCNKYGLYHMLGNVSELTADTLVKGLNFSSGIYSIDREETSNGSYTIKAQTYNYKIDKKYIRPEPWIGFRCICEVLEN